MKAHIYFRYLLFKNIFCFLSCSFILSSVFVQTEADGHLCKNKQYVTRSKIKNITYATIMVLIIFTSVNLKYYNMR